MQCRNTVNGQTVYFGKTKSDVKQFLWYQLDGQRPDKKAVGAVKPDEIEIYDPGIESDITYTIEWDTDNPDNGELLFTGTHAGICCFTTGSFRKNYVSDADAVAASLNQRLSVIKGELWYQINHGVPLLEKYRSRTMFDAAILEIISGHPDVVNVKHFESKIDAHTYTFACEIQTIYGDVQLYEEPTIVSQLAIAGLAIVGNAVAGYQGG